MGLVDVNDITLKNPNDREIRHPDEIPLRTLENIDNKYLKRHYSQSENKRVTYQKYLEEQKEKQKQKTKNYFDYNDPEQINSFADVILNTYKGFDDKEAYINATSPKEIMNVLKNLGNLIRRGTINPLLEGDYFAVVNNALVNIGETMDVPGNIVKGAIFEGKEGVKKAVNWDGKGRTNYDVDTGFMPLDLACEILIDPMNWITFGTWGVTKASTKGVAKEVASELTQKVGKEVASEMTEKGYKTLAKKAIKAYVSNDYDTLTDAVNGIVKQFSKTPKIYKHFDTTFSKESAVKLMKNLQDVTLEIKTNEILDAVKMLTKVTDTYESTMLRGALTGTGIYPAWKVLGKIKDTTTDMIKLKQYKRWEVALKDMTKADGTLDIFKYNDIVEADTEIKNMLDVVKNFQDLEDPTNKGLLEMALANTLNHDLAKMDELFQKYDKNALDFDKALREYLGLGKTDMTAIDEYLTQLHKINEYTDHAYDDIENLLLDFKAEFEFKIKVINDEQVLKNIKAENDILESVQIIYNRLVTDVGNPFYDEFKRTIVNINNLYKKYPLETFYQKVNEDGVLKVLKKRLYDSYKGQVSLLKEIGKASKEFPEIQKLVLEAVQNINRYVVDMNKQLDTVFLKDFTEALYNKPSDIAKLKLNFNKIKLTGELNKKFNEIIDYNNSVVKKAPVFEGHRYTNLTKYIDHRKQAEMLDNLIKVTDKVQKDLGASFYIKPDNIKAIDKVKESVNKTFSGGVEEYLYVNQLNGYAEALKDAVDNFILVDPNNIMSYFDEYNNLINELYKLKNKPKINSDLSGIDKLLNELAEVSPYKMEEAKVVVQEGAIIRTLQQEKTYSNLELMNIESFNELIINGIYKNEGLGSFINTLANADLPNTDPLYQAGQSAKIILDNATHYRNYKRLLDRLVNTKLDDDLKNRFLSTIQNFASYNPEWIYTNFDYYFKDMIDRAETFQRSVTMRRALNLDAMREQEEVMNILNKLLKEDPKASKSHQALYDVYTLQAVMENEGLIEKYCTDASKHYVLFDIETFSLNASQGSVFEIAYKDINSTGQQLNLKLDPANIEQQINSTLLNTFGEKTADDFYKHRSGDISSEKEMLQNFIDMLKSYKGNVVLIGHNSDKFDVDYLIKRMKANDISSYDIRIFEHTMKLDTLTLLNHKEGYKTFQPDEVFRLKHLIRNYTEQQLKAGTTRFISPNNGGMASALNEMRHCIRAMLNSKVDNTALKVAFTADELIEMATSFGDIAGEIYNTMRNIARNNSKLSHHFLMPELFDEASELRKLLPDQFKSSNASQLLYQNVADLVNIYGYKNTIDFNKIMYWTKFTEGQEIDIKLAKSLTSLAKQLDRTRNAIKNLDFLQGKEKNIKDILNILLPKTDFSGKLSDVLNMNVPQGRLGTFGFYSHLKTDYDDTLSGFVMAQYIYNAYKNKKALNLSIEKLLGKENIDFLENTSEAYKACERKLVDIKLRHEDFTIDSDIAKPNELQKLAKNFYNNSVKPLEQLGEDNIYRARTHAMSTSLKPTQDLLNSYVDLYNSLAPEKKADFIYSLKRYTDNLGLQQLNQILNMNPNALYQYMVHNSPWIEFSIADIENNIILAQSFNNILNIKPQLRQLGIEVIEDESKRVYLVNTKIANLNYEFDKTNKVLKAYDGNVEIPYVGLKELDLTSSNEYLKDYSDIAAKLESTRNSLNKLTENISVGTLCETLNIESFSTLYNGLPDKVRNLLPPLDALSDNKFFTNMRFDTINLGSVDSRRIKNPRTANNLINTYKNQAEIIASEAKLKIHYTNLYYGQHLSINNSLFFKDVANDVEIIKALKANPEYVLTALVEDKKFGHKAVVLDVSNSKALAEARRLNAVVMPRSLLSKVMETVNGDLMNSYRKHWWNKILYAYKVGYLLDPAVWFRNIVDSSLKTMSTTQQPLETIISNKEAMQDISLYNKIINSVINLDQYDLTKVKLYGLEEAVANAIKKEKASEVLTALDLTNKYDNIIQDVIRMSPQRVGYKRFTKENLDFYFEHMYPALDRQTFDLIDAFIKDGPSAGLTSAWAKYYKEDAKNMWHTFVDISDKALSPNNKIEQINRLAEYLVLAKHGTNQDKAFYKVMKTHFDYSTKAPYEIYTEIVFPFYSFTMKNLEYWLDIAENNPSVIRQLENIMTPIFNYDETSVEDLASNKSLQYQISSGNIPLMDNGLTLKTSPSFMDSFNLLYDPLATAKSKMFGPLQTIIDICARNTGSELIKNTLDTFDYDTKEYLEASLENNYKDLSGFKDIPFIGEGIYNTLQTLQNGMKGITDKISFSELGLNDIDEKNLIYDSVPILGALMRKFLEQAPNYYDRTGNLLNLLSPGLFGATKVYQEKDKKAQQSTYRRYPKYASSGSKSNWVNYKYPRYGRGYRRNYANYSRKAYSSSGYASYRKRYYNKWVYPNAELDVGFYDKHYTKSGESRLKQLMRPNNGYSLKYKILNTKIYYNSK